MVPVKVPPRVPVPTVRLSVKVVFVATLNGAPLEFCVCTTTLNGTPATGSRPPFTEVIASRPVEVAVNVTGLPVRPVEAAVTV